MNVVILDGNALEPDLANWSPVTDAIPNSQFTFYPNSKPDEVILRSAAADVLVVNKVKLDAATLAQLPNLKLVAISATGFDNVDLEAASAARVTVCNVPIYSTDSVAQHVFAFLLSVIHRPFEHDQAIRAGQWKAAGQFTFWLSPLNELSGKAFGVVGFGRIGQATAKLALAFGMKLRVFSRTRREVQGLDAVHWCDSVEDLFATSDVISLHCPATESNHQFVDAELLAKMKPSAILINTARGALINEADLADSLNREVLRAACLDVLSAEPVADDNPLLNAKNCLLTPHIAWTTVEARARLIGLVADNVRAFHAGNPSNVLNSN